MPANRNSYNRSFCLVGIAWAAVLFFFLNFGLSLATDTDDADPFSGKIISDISVRISGAIGGDTRHWETIARDLIPFTENDIYSIQKIEQAISRLVDSNLFRVVDVPDPELDSRGVRLFFSLVPFGRIKDIVVRNAFPLFYKEIINAMTIDIGDSFSETKLAEQEKRIRNLFVGQGYFNPDVTVSSDRDDADGNFIVTVEIEKGPFYSINKVEIIGNHHFSSARLKFRISTWKSSVLFGNSRRFVQRVLEEDIKNFVAFYRQNGFADVRVGADTVKNEAQRTVDIIFHIDEGPLYDISFLGNEAFWDVTLKKEVTLFKEGNKNNFALKKSMRNIKNRYIEDGYLDAAVENKVIDETQQSLSTRKVVLEIDEGLPYRVERIEILGNKVVSENEILKSMLTITKGIRDSGIYVPKVLDEDIKAVKTLYFQQGFTKVRVEKKISVHEVSSSAASKQKTVDIQLIIQEGVQTRINTIEFGGLSVLSTEEAMSATGMIPGAVFNESAILAGEKNLQQKISEAGYPHVKVTSVTEFSADGSLVNIGYQITEGPRVSVGQVFYTGNFRTREDFLDSEMEIRPGQPLLLSGLLESRRNLMDVNALESVRFRTIGLKNMEDEVDIVVEVSEKKPYFFEIGTGYDTERHLYVDTLVGDHNFWGRNMELQSGMEFSQIGYKADISLTSPRIFSSKILSSTRIFTENREEFNKDFGISTYGASQNFSKSFLDKQLITDLGIVYEYREQYLTGNQESAFTESELYLPRHILVVSPGIIYKTTDSFVRPRKGIFSSLNLDISKGIGNDRDDFIKYRIDSRYYYTPFDPLTLAVRGRYGFIQPYGSNVNIPEDQLFFLGGTSTVRGFDENLLRFDVDGQAVGGREIILGSLEARYDIGMNLELTAFYDIGMVAKTQGGSDMESFRDSVGLGLRYMTPIGPIGFLYGWKLETMPNESPGSLHFSMGYTF